MGFQDLSYGCDLLPKSLLFQLTLCLVFGLTLFLDLSFCLRQDHKIDKRCFLAYYCVHGYCSGRKYFPFWCLYHMILQLWKPIHQSIAGWSFEQLGACRALKSVSLLKKQNCSAEGENLLFWHIVSRLNFQIIYTEFSSLPLVVTVSSSRGSTPCYRRFLIGSWTVTKSLANEGAFSLCLESAGEP